MGGQNNKKSDFALIVAYIAFLTTVIFFPPFYFFAVILLPVPLVVYAFRNKQERTYMIVGAIAVISLLLTVVFQTLLFVPLFVVFAAGGLTIGLALQKEKNPYEIWIQGIIAYLVSLLFVFVFTQVVLEINWAEEVRTAAQDTLNNMATIIKQIDPSIKDQLEGRIETIRDQIEYLPNLIPVGITVLSIIFSFLAQWLSYKVINALFKQRLSFPPVRKLSFPRAVIFIYLIGFLLMFIENDPSRGLFMAGQNITSLMFFLMVIQGFTYMFFFTHHKKKSNLLPIIIIIVSLLMPFLMYFVHFLGLFDIALSLRKRTEGNQKR